MNKALLFAASLSLLFFLHINTASAHQPEYAGTATIITIPDPETSRAYYGELTGAPAIYTITSDKEFSLYVSILSPYLPGAKKDFKVHITNSTGSTITDLNSPVSDWPQWYEEFAGDTYWKGPEFKEIVPAGTYTIEVSNPDNRGKYVLAPGEAEVFTLTGTPGTIQHLYVVKTLFFDKPWYSIFEGVIGKMLLAASVFLLLLIGMVGILLLRRRQKKHL